MKNSAALESLSASLASSLLIAVGRTLKLRERRQEFSRARLLEERRNVIFAAWHNRLFYLMYYMVRQYHWHGVKFAVMISRSRDGARLAGVIRHLGGAVCRGSSSRGGTRALRELVGYARRNFCPAIAPDGPRGPRYRAQPGIIRLAQVTGCPIVPVGCAVEPSIELDSWDRFLLPVPFGRAAVVYEDPIEVPRRLSPRELACYQQDLESALQKVTHRAESIVSRRTPKLLT